MGILVCYDDFTYDVVTDHHLEYLLEKGCIIGYDNSGEWVKMEAPRADPGLAPPPRKRRSRSGSKSARR